MGFYNFTHSPPLLATFSWFIRFGSDIFTLPRVIAEFALYHLDDSTLSHISPCPSNDVTFGRKKSLYRNDDSFKIASHHSSNERKLVSNKRRAALCQKVGLLAANYESTACESEVIQFLFVLLEKNIIYETVLIILCTIHGFHWRWPNFF